MASSSPLRVILLGATGTVGVHIANGFLLPEYAPKVVLTIVSRQATAETAGPKKDLLDGFVKQGAKIVHADISSATEADLIKLFSGQDVVVSAVAGSQLTAQARCIVPAQKAGVKWFVPSEFGVDHEIIGRGSVMAYFDDKIAHSEAIHEAGLDVMHVNTGNFAEYVLSPFSGLDLANSTQTAQGGADVAFNTTPLAEVGRQVADAIVTGRGRNQTIHTGETITYAQLGDLVERITGKKLTRKVRTVAEAHAEIAANPQNTLARYGVIFGSGKGTSWPQSETYAVKNNLKVQTFEEFARKALAPK